MDDHDLIARVLTGDPTAERALYDRNVDRVYRLIYRMVGEADLAQDFTQDTFIRAFDRLAGFRGEAALSTWLCSIAVSMVYNGMRKVKRFRQREVALDDATPVGVPPAVGEPDLRERLGTAIDGLPDGYRTVFLMHDLEGFTHEEIGAALGVHPGTSKAQLSRARSRLRRDLAPFAGETAS